MLEKILIPGAGLVASAYVRYLFDQPDFYVTLASYNTHPSLDMAINRVGKYLPRGSETI